MTAAIYCRYSTDKQADTSIEDQARVCRAAAERLGVVVTAVRADDGISGSTPIAKRPGGKVLLADVLAKRMDVLIVESLDRLSRDQVDLEQTVRRIERAGIRIVGVSDGYDSTMGGRKLVRTMRGLIGEMYLDDLREKTHRGLSGRIAQSAPEHLPLGRLADRLVRAVLVGQRHDPPAPLHRYRVHALRPQPAMHLTPVRAVEAAVQPADPRLCAHDRDGSHGPVRHALLVAVRLVVQAQRPDDRIRMQVRHSTSSRQRDSHHAHQSRVSSIRGMTAAAARPGRR